MADAEETHLCRCTNCYPPLNDILEPAPNHFGLQFPGQSRTIRVYKISATIEVRQLGQELSQLIPSAGEDISQSCWQVETGTTGKAWRYSAPRHRCHRCGTGVCSYIDRGHFTVAGAISQPSWWEHMG